MTGLLAPFIATVFVLWSAFDARQPARVVRGVRVVEYTMPQKVVMLVGAVALSYFFVPALFAGESERQVALVAVLPMLLFAIVSTAYSCVTRIRFDDREIDVVTLWRGRRVIPFSAVRSVEPGLGGWKVVTTHGSIRFNHLQRGWKQFREALRDACGS